jgi:hypothetical protein
MNLIPPLNSLNGKPLSDRDREVLSKALLKYVEQSKMRELCMPSMIAESVMQTFVCGFLTALMWRDDNICV